VSLTLILAQGIGQLLASVFRAREQHGAVAVVTAAEQAATTAINAVEAHINANASEGVTIEEFRAKVEAVKAEALAAGDEAQARIDARADESDQN